MMKTCIFDQAIALVAGFGIMILVISLMAQYVMHDTSMIILVFFFSFAFGVFTTETVCQLLAKADKEAKEND